MIKVFFHPPYKRRTRYNVDCCRHVIMYMCIANGEANVLVESGAKNRPRVYTIRNLTPTNNNNKKKKPKKLIR